MHKKKNILIILPVFFLGLSSFNYSKNCYPTIPVGHTFLNYNKTPEQSPYGVLVGHRTGATTAQLVISKSGIQQNIINTVPQLSGASVTDEAISIHISAITGYLLFKANNAAGKKMTVAIELVSDNNDLLFQAESGMEIHVCKSSGTCNSCEFNFDLKRITGCSCSSVITDSTGNSNCDHVGSLLK